MEKTPQQTRSVLLKGCRAHVSENVSVMKLDLSHAIGAEAANKAIFRHGTFKGKTVVVSFNRKRLIQILESADQPTEG